MADTNNTKTNVKPLPPVMYNNVGKTPSEASFVFTVDEIREAVLNIASGYIPGLTKDRIKISLVVDNDHTVYNKETKRNEPTSAVVIALYFDINDPSFVQTTDNDFGITVQKDNDKLKQFMSKFSITDNNGNPYGASRYDRGTDGRKYRYMVLNIRTVFETIMDASGWGYEQQYGQRGPKVIISVEVNKRNDGNRITIDSFKVTKSIFVEKKAEIQELTSKKLRGIIPQFRNND